MTSRSSQIQSVLLAVVLACVSLFAGLMLLEIWDDAPLRADGARAKSLISVIVVGLCALLAMSAIRIRSDTPSGD